MASKEEGHQAPPIAQGVLQQNVSKFYEFESAENVCIQF